MNRYKKIDKKHNDSKNYKVDLENIHSMKTLDDYIQFYKYTNYMDLSWIFGLHKQLFIKQGESNHSYWVIDALLIFWEGIKPEWEDINHQKGGYLQADVNLNGMEFINEFWEIVFANLIAGDIEGIEEITGIRILNNTKTHNTLWFEIWLTCGLEYYRERDEG